MIRRFDRYFLSRLMMLFGFFALILVAVYWVNRAVLLFDELIADGQSAWVFFEFTALTLPNVVRLVLPVAAFVAAVYTTNRLWAESELVVAQAAGMSPWRMARPVALFGLIVALMMAVLVHALVPASRSALNAKRAEITADTTAGLLKEGTFLHPAKGLTVYIRQIDDTGALRDIFVWDDRAEGEQITHTARRAFLLSDNEGVRLVMFDGMAQSLDRDSRRLAVTRFSEFSLDLAALGTQIGDRRLDPDEVSTISLLRADPQVQERLRISPDMMRYAGHERFAQSLVALAVPLIGFGALMTAGFSRFGLWRQIVLATSLLVAVQFLVNGVASQISDRPELWPAVYLPPLVALAAAWGLLFVAGRPWRRRAGSAMAVPS
ncbi:lipopolysaccharide export system permease protein [Albidovulum inexpectatum]|uniref:Lipopolysaccharide export system permease protein n=1 Tax=Albidovulum inexpectatum TaxID=196587 RepID=A0A2S5JJD0_9RHOB|nr:LPS export ABC transporter permease LptF [Albidovulum inexpectatum]PPB81616.1 lipopolysaccharide export system permease protein [Albidovulum inexpectatum]